MESVEGVERHSGGHGEGGALKDECDERGGWRWMPQGCECVWGEGGVMVIRRSGGCSGYIECGWCSGGVRLEDECGWCVQMMWRMR